MSVSFFFDHHVDTRITHGLRLRGITVLTAEEDVSSSLEDEALLFRATSRQQVLFSQDEDLLSIARHWQRAPPSTSPG